MSNFESNELLIRTAIKTFTGVGVDFTVTPEKIDKYLSDTMESSKTRSDRLMELATSHGFSWEEICQIYSFMKNEPEEEVLVPTIMWTATGLSLMQEVSRHRFDDRFQIAADVNELLLHALGKTPEDPSVANSLGFLYLHRPVRREHTSSSVATALSWYQRGLNWATTPDIRAESHLGLANTFFKMRRFSEALDSYAKAYRDEEPPDEVREKIAECERNV